MLLDNGDKDDEAENLRRLLLEQVELPVIQTIYTLV
jgi:hypothetical protein